MILFLVLYFISILSDQFDDEIAKIKADYTPFIGKEDTANYTKTPYMLLGFTFDSVTRELRLPIIDMGKSPITNQTRNATRFLTYNFDSVADYLDTMNSLTSDEYPFVNGMFSHTKDVVSMYKTYFSGNCELVVAQQEYTYWTKSVNPGSIVFNEEFQEILKLLPQKYDKTMYSRFIQEFGTHVSFMANFGGLIEIQIFLEDCAYDLVDKSTIQAQSIDDLLWYIAHSQSNRTSGDEQYIERRYVYTEDITGGNPLIDCGETCDERISTFIQNPVVTSFTYVSIPYLVEDQTISDNLNTAIGDYNEGARTSRTKSLDEVAQDIIQEALAPKTVTVTLSEDIKDQMRYQVTANSTLAFSIQRGDVTLPFWIERQNYQIRLSVTSQGKKIYGSWGNVYSMIAGVMWQDGKFIYDSDVYGFYDCEQVIDSSSNDDQNTDFKCACPVFT